MFAAKLTRPKSAAGSARLQVPPGSRLAGHTLARSAAARAPAAVIGNQAALKLAAEHGLGLSSASAPVSGVQPKLRVGATNDGLEQEADRVADRIMRAPLPSGSSTGPKCSACEDEERKVPKIRRKTDVPDVGSAGEAPAVVHDVLRSPGDPLDPAARTFFEPRFGRDFANVRVHRDARAANSARSIGAVAYTAGNDIVFDAGQYRPHEPAGRRLLAHELAHVVQQGGGAGAAGAAPGVQPLQRTDAPMVQRAMRKGCIAPSFVVDFATASAFGMIAEALVEADYIAQKGGTPFADVFLDNPLGPMSYVAFLVAHHPSLNKYLLAAQISLSGGILVPDILDTRSDEFYDVKPDSKDGHIAGRAKLAALDAFMTFNKLPYIRGTSYTPSSSLPIPLANAALTAAILQVLGPSAIAPALACGTPVATLAPRRAAAGLLVYEICVEADLDCYLKVMSLEALIAIVIIAAIIAAGAAAGAGGGVPVPA